MPLPPITLLTEIDELTPQGDSATVAELDDYIRQLKGFVKQFLQVAHTNTGELKELSRELSFDNITGNLSGDRIEPDTITSVHVASKVTSDSALLRQNIADDAIGTDELANDAVTSPKIAAGAVEDKHIVTVAAAKITGELPSAHIAPLQAEEVEPSHVKGHADFSAADPGLLVLAKSGGLSINNFAKITGALSAELIAGNPGSLQFSFKPAFSVDTGILALLRESAINTPSIVPGATRVRNGWTVSGGANFVQVGDVGGLTNAQFTIDRNGFYLIFVYATVYGALASPGTIEVYSRLRKDNTDTVFDTNVAKTATEVNLNHPHFGMGTVSVDGSQSYYLETFLGAGSGTWVIGENGKVASIIGIIGLA